MEKKDRNNIIGSIRMTLNRDQIMTFVSVCMKRKWN
jgi:hypothetical protein